MKLQDKLPAALIKLGTIKVSDIQVEIFQPKNKLDVLYSIEVNGD